MIVSILHARLDGEGRLLEGDRNFALINGAAGGGVGRPLALPALATLVRLARRLGTLIAREVTFADGDRDIDAWARVQPESDGLRLTLSQIRERPAVRPIGATPAPIGDWQWEADHAGRVTFLSANAAVEETVLGRPIDQLFRFADGELPDEQEFHNRPATMVEGGGDVLVSAVPRLDREGRFAGYRGAVEQADARRADGSMLTEMFTTRLDGALRGTLGRIIANADSIHAQTEGPLQGDYADYAADIASAGRHLLGLVDDISDLQAIERADFAVEAEAIDLADVARRAAGLLSVRAADSRVTIARPALDEVMPARGDFRRTLQILVNLIGNAVRYSPAGEVVMIAAGKQGDRATVTIADSGKGIASDDQVRVFEKFERIDPSEPGGNGLGLYIARRLARAMDGDLSVESAPGDGARFTLSLPTP